MKYNPFKIVSHFEETMAEYCGSKYAVAVNSCTNALFLVCLYHKVKEVIIPSRTYISPALSIIHAGGEVILDTLGNHWSGIYQLRPYPIYDAAKRLRKGMYIPENDMCLSFHIKKPLKIAKGGMVLTDNLQLRDWLRKASYEGRSRELGLDVDDIIFAGWNMYMRPSDAARGLELMQSYPDDAPDLPNNYRDLTTFSLFKGCKVV